MAFRRYRFSTRSDAEFTKTLRKRVDAYFKEHGMSRHANAVMILKTIFVFTLAFGPLVVMLTGVVENMWALFGMWAAMAIGMAAIGTSVMHDALHGSYSKNPVINKILGGSINLLGASGKMWHIQHNVLHHSFTNMHDSDEDINGPAILRFHPHQERMKIHKYQHLYAWFLYGLSTLMWITTKDFTALFRYKNLGLLKNGKDFKNALTEVVIWKFVYYGYILVLPLIFIPAPWWAILLMFVSMHFIMGFALSVVFQTAHVIPTTEMPEGNQEGKMERNWHVHQLLTTANFSQTRKFGGKLVTWFTGGLNYQVEHHLFPNICHIHYPKIAPIVKATAEEFKIPYYDSGSLMDAVRCHASMLRRLGRVDQPAV